MVKTSVPKSIRNSLWKKYMGTSINGLCTCCNTEQISVGNFECGHIESSKNGGLTIIDNLRPICGLCNKSMGTQNMNNFMKKYELEKLDNTKDNYYNDLLKIIVTENDEEICKIGNILFNIDNSETMFELWNKIKKKSITYEQMKELWNNFKFTSSTLCIIKDTAKKNNYIEYTKWYDKYDKKENIKLINELSEANVAIYFKKCINNNFLYKNREWYVIEKNNLWKRLTKNENSRLFNVINTTMKEKMTELKNNVDLENEILKKIPNASKKTGSSKFVTGVIEYLKDHCACDVKFDNKWNLFGFNNVVYDLEKDEFRNYEYHDYISVTSGYDWREPSKEEIELIEKLIKQIMPDEKERDLYLQILATSMSGKCVERFIIFSGSGGNGKGMIDDLLLTALGNYAMIGNNSILFETNKTGSNPEKSNIHKKRLVLFREPCENKKFENSIIKELTGGGTFSARGHHETNTVKELNLTMIIEANKKPLFAEEPTDADTRRIIDIYFGSKYTTDKELIDENKKIHLANEFYKTEEFKNKYKYALLQILMNSYADYKKNNFLFNIPKSIKERTALYLEMSCNILQWFKDNYKHTEDKYDICKMKDLYDDFISGVYFINLSKNEKRKYNKSYFSNYISTNSFFGKYYKMSHNHITNCIVGWRKKMDDEMEEDLEQLNL